MAARKPTPGEITDLDRAFAKRLRAEMKTQRLTFQELAGRAGVSVGHLNDSANLKRRAPRDKLQDIADALRMPIGKLLRAPGIPIISSTAAGALADPSAQLRPEDFPDIEIPDLPPGDYFATRVDGTSMNRVSPDGALIIVNRAERDLIPGKRYVFSRRGETTYKRWECDPPRLEPESTDERHRTIFPSGEEEWTVIGRVVKTILDL